MKNHKSVGALITNKDRTKYLVQQKDASYRHEQWVGKYSTWGGAIEEGEDIKTALYRELREELSFDQNQQHDLYPIGSYMLYPRQPFQYQLFEVRLDTTTFEYLQTIEALEGYKICLLRKELPKVEWVWGLEMAIQDYFINLL